MRLGAQLLENFDSPEAWIRLMRKYGYKAAFCPATTEMPDALIEEYRLAAKEADLVIAEVGAWNINPLSDDPAERERSISACIAKLELAEKIGASCCVGLSGTRHPSVWYAAHPDNESDETFERIVSTYRRILDAVQPQKTFFAFETMQWLPPDSVDSYERLLELVDRPSLAVHYDPVNLVLSPASYFHNTEAIRAFVDRLGSRIKSVHLKDTLLEEALTVRLKEVVPGRGNLDYPVLLAKLAPLGTDLPLMVEHLQRQEDIDDAVGFIRRTADRIGVKV